ncbi:MAG: hypothetical protein D6696_01775 [Acidobacteria bacterium]|nr:MAG: hypothetical protein D6696_01775 [Acidobacteriota bacterium]
MNERNDHDHAIARAIEGLTASDPAAPPPTLPPRGAGEEADALTREYVEALALLAFSDEPAVPDPAIRRRLMSEVARAAPVAETLPPARADVPPAPVVNLAERAPQPAAVNRWLLAMAAMLALAVVGVSFLAGQVSAQRVAIDQLQAAGGLLSQQTYLLSELLAQKEQNLKMVTVTAKRVYPMRPVANERGEMPEGRIYVCGRHQQWYLSLSDLPPPPEGKEYHLWFNTDQGPIDGGPINVFAERPAERAAPYMPPGTRSFSITLEAKGPHNAPEGELILVADRSIQL